MKRFFLLSVVAFLLLTSCLPILEEKHEFIVEVVGNAYLNDVKNWYQPSYSDYLIQEHPVLLLYYESGTDPNSPYFQRQIFYEKNGDFVAAAGVIVGTAGEIVDTERLTSIWQNYTPIYDVDVWYQYDEDEWQARVRPLSRLELVGNRVFLVKFVKDGEYFRVLSITEPSYDQANDVYHLGQVDRDSTHGFAVFVQEVLSSKTVTPESERKILGAEVVWPE